MCVCRDRWRAELEIRVGTVLRVRTVQPLRPPLLISVVSAFPDLGSNYVHAGPLRLQVRILVSGNIENQAFE